MMEEVSHTFEIITKSLSTDEKEPIRHIHGHNRIKSETMERSASVDQLETKKIFGKLPAEIMQFDLSKPQLMRLSVIYEWIETEADYVRDLITMITVSQFCELNYF